MTVTARAAPVLGCTKSVRPEPSCPFAQTIVRQKMYSVGHDCRNHRRRDERLCSSMQESSLTAATAGSVSAGRLMLALPPGRSSPPNTDGVLCALPGTSKSTSVMNMLRHYVFRQKATFVLLSRSELPTCGGRARKGSAVMRSATDAQ